MNAFEPRSEIYEELVREAFTCQGFMKTLSAAMTQVEPGFVEIRFPYHHSLTQQHGYIHAGALTAIVDSAGGFAAQTLLAKGDSVLTVEFKINLVAPAQGDHFVARGQVVRPGKTLTITQGEVLAIKDGVETQCAIMQQTMMRIARNSYDKA